uniref:Uncharacterized protein n=1 Tax=Arundo donax TaxID=35708 RepID=A0A0A8Z0D2_ARUDO
MVASVCYFALLILHVRNTMILFFSLRNLFLTFYRCSTMLAFHQSIALA